ncbi:MAG: 16S rRNA (uracil(1498)-N(3))-methyltransferase [Ottowia sp.]
MTARFHLPPPLAALPEGSECPLPASAARHVQVLRLQPGQAITVFDGLGGQYSAHITRMGRSEVIVRLGAHQPIEREARRRVHLLTGLMASERMDWLIEKATELGTARITALLTRHCALRPSGAHAAKKHAHWQAIASAACEQSGRNRLPLIDLPRPWDNDLPNDLPPARLLLSLSPQAPLLREHAAALPAGQPVCLLSGPEGGLSDEEQARAQAAGFAPVSLGPRTLRAETAPIAALALLAE